MSNFKNTFIASGSALLLSLSLVACGGGATSGGDSTTGTAATGTTSSAPANYSHDAVLEPKDIECGWLEADNTSDLWYPNGDKNAEEYIYYTNGGNDAGMTLTTGFTDKRPESMVWDLEIKDKHLMTKEGAKGEERSVDITFQDNFTCYDAVTDTTYIRGDYSQDAYNSLFENKTFAQSADGSGLKVAFGKDGKVTESYGKQSNEGTYEVIATNVVHLVFDDFDKDYRFTVANDAVTAINEGYGEDMGVVNS